MDACSVRVVPSGCSDPELDNVETELKMPPARREEPAVLAEQPNEGAEERVGWTGGDVDDFVKQREAEVVQSRAGEEDGCAVVRSWGVHQEVGEHFAED